MRFLKLFKKKDPTLLQSAIKTDMHSHFIPGIDDGVKTPEEACFLIGKMHESGITKIVTTPHIRGEVYENTPEIILKGLEDIREQLSAKNISVQIEAAAEYFADDYFTALITNKSPLLTFGKNNNILIEFSHYSPPLNYKSIIFDLQSRGYTVILAHPERYYYFHKNFQIYFDLYERGVQFQLNLVSLSGFYDGSVAKIADKIIDAGLYSFAGSDIHNKFYLDAWRKSLKTKSYQKLFEKCNIMNDSIF